MNDDQKSSDASIHEPVLLHEVIKYLEETGVDKRSRKDLWYLDGTLGGAGHATAIAKVLEGNVNIIALDQDISAIDRARTTLAGKIDEFSPNHSSKLIFECENFRNLDKVLDKHGVQTVDMILLDLGFSSDELENSGKGFSFQKDEPLLMTMGDVHSHMFTARDIVNRWTEEDIANVIFGYGEERFARRIARAIINYRTKKQIETTFELVEVVKMSVPGFYRRGKTNPATKTFQGLRIAVNDELNSLKEGLVKGFDALNVGGRMAVISFHSLEDRIVKDFYKEKAKSSGAIILTKKPIVASDQERAENPRSRSAKLRIIEKSKIKNQKSK